MNAVLNPWCLIIVNCALVVVMATGCDKPAPAASEQPVPKVTVTAVVSQETIDADEYTGQTEASESVEVRARVFGFLKTVEFKDGDYVEEGKTLFTIEPDEYEAIHQQSVSRVALNDANLAVAKSKHARNAKLVTTGAVTREEYDETLAAQLEAEARIAAAKADVNRTAVDLKYTVLKAPISGRIDRALVSRGNLLTGGQGSGTLLTKIVQEQPMYVYFDVDERSLLKYMRQRESTREQAPGSLRTLGIPCLLQLADEKDFSHEGQLDFASAEVDRTTGTARIRGVFENKDRSLVSGLFVRVKIPVSQPYQALLIPERALATDQNIKFVYVVGSDGVAKRRTVELGGQRGEMRIITAGLQADDRVIVKGLQRVRPDQKVDAETADLTTVHKPVSGPAFKRRPPVKVPNATSTPQRAAQER